MPADGNSETTAPPMGQKWGPFRFGLRGNGIDIEPSCRM
jgi:hypothetical protein